MNTPMKPLAFTALTLGALLPATAWAEPVLQPQVDVAGRVVTVGDMFKDAGALATQPLFLAPAPGTSGDVSLADVRAAADRAGLDNFDDRGADVVRVTRLATEVTSDMLTRLMSDDLKSRGALTGGVTARASFDQALNGIDAAAVPDPVQLVNLRYAQDSGLFVARFTLAGIARPLDVSGRIDLMTEAPELTTTLPAGTILKAEDVVQQMVPLALVVHTNVATADELVGKALQRQVRAGVVLHVTDVADPQVVARNDMVTVYLHAGAMTLSIRGTALNSASEGESVAVLNASSKRVLHGTARADGSVEIAAAPVSVAGL